MMKIKSGWITPNKEFVECSYYQHFSIIKDHKGIESTLGEWFAEKMRELEQIKEACEDMSTKGEHPEWHIYNMYEDDLRPQIIKKLKESGYIRVGSSANSIHFEGKLTDSNMIQFCKDFAESHGMDYALERNV